MAALNRRPGRVLPVLGKQFKGIVFRDRKSDAAHKSYLDQLEKVEQREIEARSGHHDEPSFSSDEHTSDAEEHRENCLQ